jgi:hypothetical protein
VYVTLQLPALRVHVVELKDPVELVENVTVPVGVIAPVPEASETVAVHVVAALSKTLAGEHVTLVEEALIVEVTVNAVLALPV